MAGRGQGEHTLRVVIRPHPRDLGAQFDEAYRRINDFRPAWRQLAPMLAAGVASIIGSQGAAIGRAWEPLDRRYLRRKTRDGYGGQSMRRTGALVAQLTSPTAGVLKLTQRRLSFGSRLPYAASMHFGFGFGKRHIKIGTKRKIRGRDLIGWTDAMRSDAVETMAAHVRAVATEALAKPPSSSSGAGEGA